MINRRNQLEQDEHLANFTDRLMAGEVQDVTGREADRELAQLEETVRRIKQTFPSSGVDGEMKNRIRVKLTAEWRKNSSPVRNTQRSFLPASRTWSLALAVSAIVIITLIITFVPTNQTGMSGAAGTGNIWIPIVIFIIVIAGLLFWQLRKK